MTESDQVGSDCCISGPPDPEFGKEVEAHGFVKQVMRLLCSGVGRKAKSRRVSFSFLFMRANGSQLREITRLFDAGVIRPVMDRVFPFESSNEAMAYVEAGRAKGKCRSSAHGRDCPFARRGQTDTGVGSLSA